MIALNMQPHDQNSDNQFYEELSIDDKREVKLEIVERSIPKSASLSEIIGATSDPMKLCIDFILRWSCRTYGEQYSWTCGPKLIIQAIINQFSTVRPILPPIQ